MRKNLWEFLVAPSAQIFLKKKFNELDLKNCEQFRFSINSLQLRNHLIVLIFLWKHFLGKINSTAHSLTHISLLYLFLSAILFSSCSSNLNNFFLLLCDEIENCILRREQEWGGKNNTLIALPKKEILKLKACDKISG